MDTRRAEWIPTRSSLLGRIRNPDDEAGWREFYETYRRLIAAAARRRGLNEAEVEDVTQDTMIAVQRTMSRFQYDPNRCSFKSWLGRLADQRITDFLRRRPPGAPRGHPRGDSATGPGERLEEAAESDPGAIWEAEWREGVLKLVLRRLKLAIKPLCYQVFYLRKIKGQPPRRVARALGIGVTKVYLENHRAGRVFRRLAATVRKQMERNEVATVAADSAP